MSTTIKNWKRRNISPSSIKTSIIAQLYFFARSHSTLLLIHFTTRGQKASFDFRDLLASWLAVKGTYTVDRISANSLGKLPSHNPPRISSSWLFILHEAAFLRLHPQTTSEKETQSGLTILLSRRLLEQTLLGALLTGGNYIHFSSRQGTTGVPRFTAKEPADLVIILSTFFSSKCYSLALKYKCFLFLIILQTPATCNRTSHTL